MEVFGLPLHPLIVHGAVVLVPLAALGGIGISLITPLRTRYGSLVALVALVAAITTFVTQEAGESFLRTFKQTTPAIERHARLGDGLLLWVIILFVGIAAVMLADRMIKRDHPRGKITLAVGAVITVVSGVVSIVQVVRIGHAGATAVWGSG